MRQAINVDLRHRGIRYEISSRESLAALARASEMASCRTHGGRFPPEPPLSASLWIDVDGGASFSRAKMPSAEGTRLPPVGACPADIQASVTSHGICRRSMSA